MSSSIYNFFQFLEKKVQKTLPPEQATGVKLRYAKELATDNDIKSLNLKQKIFYYPELVKGPELIIEGNYSTPAGTVLLPEGLTVNGILTVTALEKKPVNIKANSVTWHVNSSLYPDSFNGATFKIFQAKDLCDKLPDNIRITKQLSIYDSNVQKLPEGLEVEKVSASKHTQRPGLQALPSKLTCNILDISYTSINEIPDGVVVKEKLILTKLPEKYPKHIEDVISVGGYLTMKEIKKYEAYPETSLTLGKKGKEGKGIVVPLQDINTKQVTDFLESFYKLGTPTAYLKNTISKLKEVGDVFKIRFEKLGIFVSHRQFFYVDFVAYGKDDKNREVLLISDFLTSLEGKVSIKSLYSGNPPSEDKLISMMTSLFPKSYDGKKPEKAVNIRTLMDGENSKEVYWRVGRKVRKGYGVEGQAKDFIPSLSQATRDNLTWTAKEKNVTWGDMIVFDNQGSINLITRSKDKYKDDEYLYFDKYGFGQGGSWKFFIAPDYSKS